MDGLTIVILAAGKGKWMRSRQPKVFHRLCGRPLLGYALRTGRVLADRIVVVAGPGAAPGRAPPHRATGAAATVLTAVVDRPQGYGRILRQGGRVKRIVEERDATDDHKKTPEINPSVSGFDARRLWKALGELRPDNDQGEYYLTDVIGILAKAGGRIHARAPPAPAEAAGSH